jgi:hypothetical protein
MSSSEEFDVDESHQEEDNQFFSTDQRKRKHTKEDAMLGVFNEDSDQDEYTPGKYTYQR